LYLSDSRTLLCHIQQYVEDEAGALLRLSALDAAMLEDIAVLMRQRIAQGVPTVLVGVHIYIRNTLVRICVCICICICICICMYVYMCIYVYIYA